MHCLYLVTGTDLSLARDRAKSRAALLAAIWEQLAVLGVDGRTPVWLAIGGRWSGLLSRLTWARPVMPHIRRLLDAAEAALPPEPEQLPRAILCAPWSDAQANAAVLRTAERGDQIRARRAALRESAHARAQVLYDAARPACFRYQPLPFARPTLESQFAPFGWADDVMPLTSELFVALFIAPARANRPPVPHLDLDGDRLDRTMIGRKWVAVVDCLCRSQGRR